MSSTEQKDFILELWSFVLLSRIPQIEKTKICCDIEIIINKPTREILLSISEKLRAQLPAPRFLQYINGLYDIFNENLCIIAPNGDKFWRTSNGLLHNDTYDYNGLRREAVRRANGAREWWVDGQLSNCEKDGLLYPVAILEDCSLIYKCDNIIICIRNETITIADSKMIISATRNRNIMEITAKDSSSCNYYLSCGVIINIYRY